jgi:3-phosphoglycerate kinase
MLTTFLLVNAGIFLLIFSKHFAFVPISPYKGVKGNVYIFMSDIKFLSQNPFTNKTVIMRADFNVSLNEQHQIANDERVKQSLLTIRFLLSNNNRVIILSHLEPNIKTASDSLHPVAIRLQKFITEENVVFANNKAEIPASARLVLMENTRQNAGEKANDPLFAAELATLGEIFVQDAFGVCHREHASVVGLPKLLPSYGGLLLEKEMNYIGKVLSSPTRPLVAVLGGAKLATKLGLVNTLAQKADYVLLGGLMGLEYTEGAQNVIIPRDYIEDEQGNKLDIGPKTQELFSDYLYKAKTIVWNGPVGYVEDIRYKAGTKSIYHAIVSNKEAISIVGGGDTITAISHENDLQNISHISTGGGAMLEFIEKGTLVGIEALKQN